MKTLVTGSSGFVGRAVVRRLLASGHTVRATGRAIQPSDNFNDEKYQYAGGYELDSDTDWMPALSGIDVVVHAAARVHQPDAGEASALPEFMRANTHGTLRLASQAQSAGVRRFVFISTAKVLGESTAPGQSFHADDEPRPEDGYSRSKFEAELGLRSLSDTGSMEVTIVRPPLVYGPGVRANFLSMMKWLDAGVPLPLARIDNRRSLVGLENLADLIAVCATHPAAANQIFMAADGTDLSTPELLTKTAQALGKTARLLPVPVSWLRLAASMLGKQDVVQRLCESLCVDVEKNRKLLGWEPVATVEQELERTAQHYLREARRR